MLPFQKIAPLRDHRYYMTPALTDLFARTIDLLSDTRTEDNPTGKGLHYARYRAVEFFRSGILHKGRSGSHIAKLLTGIFRTHLVKRLESSFSAFKKSLHTFLTITEGMIEMFNNDKVLIAPDYNVKELQQDKSYIHGVFPDFYDILGGARVVLPPPKTQCTVKGRGHPLSSAGTQKNTPGFHGGVFCLVNRQ